MDPGGDPFEVRPRRDPVGIEREPLRRPCDEGGMASPRGTGVAALQVVEELLVVPQRDARVVLGLAEEAVGGR